MFNVVPAYGYGNHAILDSPPNPFSSPETPSFRGTVGKKGTHAGGFRVSH